jgi:hypothetical protein
MALSRSFQIGEGARLKFRAEAFNVPDAVRRGNPNTNSESSQFGEITSAGDRPRKIPVSPVISGFILRR